MEPNPVRWLVAANLVWLMAGVLAYFTPATLVIGTAVALVLTLPGLLELRRQAPEQHLDQALAGAVGTWTLMAVLVLIPYVASEDGLTLWSSAGFQGVGLAAASLGFLWWNLSAATALGHPRKSMRPWVAFHVVTLLAALYFLPGDGVARDVVLRGETYSHIDLRASPLAAALPGLLWAAALAKIKAHQQMAGPSA